MHPPRRGDVEPTHPVRLRRCGARRPREEQIEEYRPLRSHGAMFTDAHGVEGIARVVRQNRRKVLADLGVFEALALHARKLCFESRRAGPGVVYYKILYYLKQGGGKKNISDTMLVGR